MFWLSRISMPGLIGLCLAGSSSGRACAAVLPERASAEIPGMRASVDDALHWVATIIEVAGVGIIVIAAVLASVMFVRQGFGVLG